MKYFVLALIIGLVVFKVFFSSEKTQKPQQIKTSQDLNPAPQVPTSGGEGSPESPQPDPTELTPPPAQETNEIPENIEPTAINPTNRIMIDQASPASAGAPSGVASHQTQAVGAGVGSPLKQGEGVKLDPSSLFFDKGSHAKIFGNENGGGSPEAKGAAAGAASAQLLDNGSPVKRDQSSLTIDVPVE